MIRCASAAFLALAPTAFLALAPTANAGWYLDPEAYWSSFSFEPTHAEATPNFYGWGAELGSGYSFRQALDFGIFGQMVPGRLHAAQIGKGDATLVSYGGELTWRIADTVLVGVHGGSSRYDSKTQSEPSELPGQWAGPSGGLILGAATRLSKTQFLQVTFEASAAVVTARGNAQDKRRLDQFALGLGLQLNGDGEGGGALGSGMIKDFLDSIIF